MCNATPGSTDNKNHGREKMTCHFLLCQLLGKNFVQHFFFPPAFDVKKRQQLNTLYSTPSTCLYFVTPISVRFILFMKKYPAQGNR